MIVPVPVRYLVGSLRKLLDRHGDPFGQIETKPGCRKDNDQCNQKQSEQVTVLNRLFENRQMLVLLVRARDLQGALGDTFGNVVIHHHHAQNSPVAAVDGHAAADDISLAEGLSARHLQPAQGAIQEVGFRLNGYPGGNLIVKSNNKELAIGRENLHGPEIVFPLFRLDKLLELLKAL